mgnify:CR=1 FL=1
MKQMTAPQAPVKEQVFFGFSGDSFFRRKIGKGEIFFGWNRSGAMYHFPVLEDGRISKRSNQFILETETVCVIHPHDIGITKIEFTDEQPSA